MVAFLGERRGPQLIPCTADDLAVLEKVRPAKRVVVQVTYDRSSPHNRWFHKLIAVVADAIGKPLEVLKVELKYKACLWHDVLMSPVFGIHIDYKSVAFKAMDESEFTDFRIKAVEILFNDYLPGIKRRDVYREVESLTGEPCPW